MNQIGGGGRGEELLGANQSETFFFFPTRLLGRLDLAWQYRALLCDLVRALALIWRETLPALVCLPTLFAGLWSCAAARSSDCPSSVAAWGVRRKRRAL